MATRKKPLGKKATRQAKPSKSIAVKKTVAKKTVAKKTVAPPSKRPGKEAPASRGAGTRAAPLPPPAAPVEQPDITAPPPPRPVRVRRVSIGEALAQLNAATLEGVTAELVPFGLNPDAPLTPSMSLASLLGPESRSLTQWLAALETWDGEGADFGLVGEATALLSATPRSPEALEAFIRRNCIS